MKKLVSILTIAFILTSLASCTRQESVLSNQIPVTFTYSSPKCEKPQIIFTGETFGDVTTVTDNTTVDLRNDQQYSVQFKLVEQRCTPGEIILGGPNPDEVNIWLGPYPASGEKQHVNLEDHYYVVVLGE